MGGINATGQVPAFGHVNLIDPDTPKEVYTKPSWAEDGKELRLVFSDEFNVDGETDHVFVTSLQQKLISL